MEDDAEDVFAGIEYEGDPRADADPDARVYKQFVKIIAKLNTKARTRLQPRLLAGTRARTVRSHAHARTHTHVRTHKDSRTTNPLAPCWQQSTVA